MEDREITDLFFERSEQAISELSKKYGKLLLHISNNVLNNREDVQECINDTYLAVWNSIPPQRPEPLSAYVCRIAKNLSLKKYRDLHAKKRNSAYDVSLDELSNCFSGGSLEEIYTAKELGQAINAFLGTLDETSRVLFLRRYWFHDSVKDISKMLGISENTCSVRLNRIRGRMREYLLKEGFSV